MPIETKGLIEGEKNKQVYRIRNRRLGMIYVALSHHASQRLEERNLNSMQLLGTLSSVSDDLCVFTDGGDVLLLETKMKLSILLSVSKTDKDIYYFNIITIIDGIPTTDDGQLRFYHIEHFLTI